MAYLTDEELKRNAGKAASAASAKSGQGFQSAQVSNGALNLSANQGTQSANLQQASPTGGQTNSGLNGVSQSTLAGLEQYGQKYTPSETVNAASAYLKDVINNQPGGYVSKYETQIADLYDQIMNREKFKYDVNKDPLYQQYKNNYMQNGQRAMQDVIGNAAALTGGYGNSWGTTAGFQAYQNYLQRLNDVVPQLEQYAFGKYQYEGDELRNNMQLTRDLDQTDYDRYRDTVQDWKDDRQFAFSKYTFESQSDQNQWNAMQDYYQNLASMENSDYWKTQNAAEAQRQYDSDMAFKQQQLAESQRQYDADLAYQQYKAALDDQYKRDSLAQSQRQYESDLALSQQKLQQSQAQWEAEQALDQAKFDFQLRQYADKLAQEAAKTAGSGSGYTQAPQQSAQKTGNKVSVPSTKTVVSPVTSAPSTATSSPATTRGSESYWNEQRGGMTKINAKDKISSGGELFDILKKYGGK